ncbi:MAG: hypothetical protein ACEQSU_15510 [Microgenomates group bacterium]
MPTKVTQWLILFAVCTASVAQAEEPLSAINWLSTSQQDPAFSVAGPTNGTIANQPAVIGEVPTVKGGAVPEAVSVTVLGQASIDAVGLLPGRVTGFPNDLWGLGKSAEIATKIRKMSLDGLPSLQSLFMTTLLAEAAAPVDSTGDGLLLLARIDKLLEIGALEQAQALISAAGPASSSEVRRRGFDVSLLLGDEEDACVMAKATLNNAAALAARVFCLARSGDWPAAALTLQTAKALGRIAPTEISILERFLDGEALDGALAPPPPLPVTPLYWRIYEAIGEPIPTSTLPPAFAHAELSDRSGWKAQLEAAERLVRAGALPGNVLLGLYTEREPAASGGVWDRADAFQRLDQAMIKGDAAAVDQRLPVAFARMRDVEIESAFASLFADRLSHLPLSGDAAQIAYQLGLLSPHFGTLANSPLGGNDPRAQFLRGLALGNLKDVTPTDSMARAIAPAFIDPVVPDEAVQMIEEHRVGEAIFLAMNLVQAGVNGELVKVSGGLSILRRLGLETVARRTALELMILERRG